MKLKFKISSTSTPAHFTEQFVYPDYRNLKFRFVNDKAKGKFIVTGNLTFIGDDFDFYIDTVIPPTPEGLYGYIITCYNLGSVYFTSDYKTVQETNRNTSKKKISISFEAETNYLSDEWNNIDSEYNIEQMAYRTNDLYFDSSYPVTMNPSNPFSFTNEDLTACNLSALALSGWDIASINITSHTGTGPYLYTGTVNYKRKEAYGFYIDTDRYDPDGELYSFGAGNWIYISDVVIAGVTYPFYRKNITPNYSCSGAGEPFVGPYTNDADYTIGDVTIEYQSITRKVSDVIEWLIGEMGLSSIAFDSSGTGTDSFYSFKFMDGESLTYGSSTTTKMYANLLIANLTNFIPADDDDQKSNRTSLTNVSLKTLHDYFESLNFEWYLEDRSGTLYYILRHKSDKTLGTTNPDLTNYKGVNYLLKANIYDKDPAEYHKITTEVTAKGLDFTGNEIVFNQVYSTDSSLVITDNKIYTDLDDIATRRADAYSEIDNNNLVLIAAQKDGSTKDYVRAATGLLTQASKNNSELGFIYLGRWIYGEYPDAEFTIIATDYTATDDRLKKRRKIKISGFAGDDIQTDFDVEDSVSFFDEDAEIDNLEQNATDYTYSINLKV